MRGDAFERAREAMRAEAYAKTCETVDRIRAAPSGSPRGVEGRRRRAYAVEANMPLSLYLEYLVEARVKALRAVSDFDRVLNRTSRAVASARVGVSSVEACAALRGVGPATIEVIEDFWARSRSATTTAYGERVPARNFGGMGTHSVGTNIDSASASGGVGGRKRAREDNDGGGPPAAATGGRKPWVPAYRSAAFAMLVTLHRLALEGRESVSKQELQDETEKSRLSEKSIKPRSVGLNYAGGSQAGAGAGGRGHQHIQYCGWSSFSALKTQKTGYSEPMVLTWFRTVSGARTMQIKLSNTGTVLAMALHRGAEERGDCQCGLLGTRAATPTRTVSQRENDADGTYVSASNSNQRAYRVGGGSSNGAAVPKFTSSPDLDWALPPLELGQKYEDAYDTVLIVDKSEGKFKDPEIFRRHGIYTALVSLPIGDFAWCACAKGKMDNRENGSLPEETYMLDFLVERKEVSDLWLSISDPQEGGKRYARQKYQMKHYSGVRHLMYLIEGDLSNSSVHHVNFRGGRGGTTVAIRQMGVAERRTRLVGARVETEVFDGFKVLNTGCIQETQRTLVHMTRALHSSYSALANPYSGKNTQKLRTFADFVRTVETHKAQEDTATITWMCMLSQIEKVGPEKAAAIANKYPTPHALKRAFDADRNPLLLANIQAGRTKVGPHASEKIQEIFFPAPTLGSHSH